MLITHLEYEAAHPGAGRQHEEDVWEKHEVTLALLLTMRIKRGTCREDANVRNYLITFVVITTVYYVNV